MDCFQQFVGLPAQEDEECDSTRHLRLALLANSHAAGCEPHQRPDLFTPQGQIHLLGADSH